MATNPNMVLIQAVTVGAGGAATISFTSIPQIYTDLVIKVSGRSTSAADQSGAGSNYDGLGISFNNSTTSWTYRDLYGTGSSASSSTGSTRFFAFVVGFNSTANTFSNIKYNIPNYISSNNKTVSADSCTENNGTTVITNLAAGIWSNSSAITSITLSLANGNFVQHSTAYLYGVTSAGSGAKATGGVITSDANYFYHTFTSSGVFTPTQSLTADYLVVAGGGGGGADEGGGGGAGGLRCTVGATGGGGSLESTLSLSATAYTVTIGAGGAGRVNSGRGTAGSNSVFSTITSTGGGGGGGEGGGYPSGQENGGSGGSGGGGTGAAPNTGGSGTSNQGYAGSAGGSAGPSYGAGGGGGAGAIGSVGTGSAGGAGGNGVSTSINGTSTTYAGGGGGGARYGIAASGGSGGGGAGSIGITNATSGTANTGGGGGGAGNDTTGGTGGSGGSGIVIVRYAK